MRNLIILLLFVNIASAQYNLFARQNFAYKAVSNGTNTEIGGVAATITSAASLATTLGISVGTISNFSIVGSDIKCKIIGSYVIPASAFYNNSSITYYFDNGNLVSDIQDQAFFQTSNFTAGIFGGITTLTGAYVFRDEINPQRSMFIEMKSLTSITNVAFYGLNTVKLNFYAPLLTSIGANVLNNDVFLSVAKTQLFYVSPFLQTSNSGGVEGDIAYTASLGTSIRYVTNLTDPNQVTDLNAGTVYNTAIQLNFTPPSSTNAIDYYECWSNGVKKNNITASGQHINGLTANSSQNIVVYAVDIFYNKSVVSNSINVYTTLTNPTDSDASAYTIASSNSTYSTAINDLFCGLKGANLYQKIQAFYPFLGTTSTQHKWNAKNPLDTDAAFRLVFTGAATFSNSGYQTDGASYANTYFVTSANQNLNSNGLTITSGTNNSVTTNTADIGNYNAGNQSSSVSVKYNVSNQSKTGLNSWDSSATTAGATNSQGIFTGTKTATSTHKLFKNGSVIATGTGGGALSTLNIWIGAMNLNGSPYGNSKQRIQFTAIHEGLSDTETATFHTIIDIFENALGRKTW